MKIQRINYEFKGDVYIARGRTGWKTITYDQMIRIIHKLNKRLTRKPYLTCDDGEMIIRINGWHPQYDCYVEYTIQFDDIFLFFRWKTQQLMSRDS